MAARHRAAVDERDAQVAVDARRGQVAEVEPEFVERHTRAVLAAQNAALLDLCALLTLAERAVVDDLAVGERDLNELAEDASLRRVRGLETLPRIACCQLATPGGKGLILIN